MTHTYITLVEQPTLPCLTRSVRRRAASFKSASRKLFSPHPPGLVASNADAWHWFYLRYSSGERASLYYIVLLPLGVSVFAFLFGFSRACGFYRGRFWVE